MDGTWWKTTADEAAAVGQPWPYLAHAVNVSFGVHDVTHGARPGHTSAQSWSGTPPQYNHGLTHHCSTWSGTPLLHMSFFFSSSLR